MDSGFVTLKKADMRHSMTILQKLEEDKGIPIIKSLELLKKKIDCLTVSVPFEIEILFF